MNTNKAAVSAYLTIYNSQVDMLKKPNPCQFTLSMQIQIVCFAVCILLVSCAQTPSNSLDRSLSKQSDFSEGGQFTVKVLGINDFHGQILPIGDEGGMHHLGRHLLSALESTTDEVFILHAGDHVGASPAESALLQDEPSITFLNHLNQYCAISRSNTCHVMGTAGNHEFDEGSAEMLRLLNGGNHERGPFIQEQWRGANYPTLSANVIDIESQAQLLAPYEVHQVNGVNIGFIGITLDSTPDLVLPGAIDNLQFENQSAIASQYVTELKAKGIKAIIIIIHDGTRGEYYEGATRSNNVIPASSRFSQFLSLLPDEVDLVVTGHSHRFTNAYVKNQNGHSFLVTQAFSNGRAYADIDLRISRETKDVTYASAKIIFADSKTTRPLSNEANASLLAIKELENNATQFAKRYTERVLNIYQPVENDIPLGEFIANSHQYALKTDLAVMNRGGVRANLSAGTVTWGQLFAVQPFGNQLVVRRFSGSQLLALLSINHYWSSDLVTANNGQHYWRGQAIQAQAQYTVGGNSYIMNSEAFSVGELIKINGEDIDATENYISRLPKPFSFRDKP